MFFLTNKNKRSKKMTIISEEKNGETKVNFFQNFQEDSVKRVNVRDIFSNMDPITKDPIEPKRVSKNPESSLNAKSLAKALGVSLFMLGGYFLIKGTNVFSYFKRMVGESNLKNLHGSEITKVKNVISTRGTLETVRETGNPFVNYATSNYKSGDSTVKFEEIKVKNFKNLLEVEKEKNVEMRKSPSRRSINVQNPIPNQNTIVEKLFNLTIDGNHVFSSSSALSLEAKNIPTWLTSTLNPNPTFKGSYITPDEATGVVVSGNYAYVAADFSGLQIIDISDPANPTFKSSYDTLYSASAVDLLGNYAYVADRTGLEIVDVSDLSNPTFKGSYDTPAIAYGVTVFGNYAYMADGESGLQIVDITDPANPTFKGSYDTSYAIYEVAISGNYAYLAEGKEGLLIIDITDHANPTLKGSYGLPDYIGAVAVFDNYAYMGGSKGVEIVDVSDPANPTFKGSYDTPGSTMALTLSGNFAYIADYHGGLQIIDISDLSNPTFKASYDLPDYAYQVALSGNCAYVADFASGLQIVALNSDELTLSGTPNFVGTYGVDIEACNEIMECATDSFDIIVENSSPKALTATLIIIGSIIVLI
jgi:hypothetical protein